ncbi:hypothetical protein [Bathymodiolus japonicus methanotrophic gill symbiont]|uniref:hypothetical protein n=1 Tax=Bathymodiolus japonicus methanotrophic gill symbiont TaxID=113269 RepID=UPI001C8DD96A|nr:hypothetical protein [Bathymodiolus japonicus methanotrophic gill symbiont]
MPPGTYTTYLMVTPAGALAPSWLWSTSFQHSDGVKGIFVNTVKEDNWIMTAVDQNDLFYSFFGAKDDAGVLQHYTQLVLDKKDSNGDFSFYLSMDFDQYSRLVGVTSSDDGGRMVLKYISESEVNVSIELDNGTTENIRRAMLPHEIPGLLSP